MKDLYANIEASEEVYISDSLTELLNQEGDVEENNIVYVKFKLKENCLEKKLIKFSKKNNSLLSLVFEFEIKGKEIELFLNSNILSIAISYNNNDIFIVENKEFNFSFKIQNENSSLYLANVSLLERN